MKNRCCNKVEYINLTHNFKTKTVKARKLKQSINDKQNRSVRKLMKSVVMWVQEKYSTRGRRTV